MALAEASAESTSITERDSSMREQSARMWIVCLVIVLAAQGRENAGYGRHRDAGTNSSSPPGCPWCGQTPAVAPDEAAPRTGADVADAFTGRLPGLLAACWWRRRGLLRPGAFGALERQRNPPRSEFAYGPAWASGSLLSGGLGPTRRGRAVPSLRYMKTWTPPYANLLDNPDGTFRGPEADSSTGGRRRSPQSAKYPPVAVRDGECEPFRRGGEDRVSSHAQTSSRHLARLRRPDRLLDNAVEALQAFSDRGRQLPPIHERYRPSTTRSAAISLCREARAQLSSAHRRSHSCQPLTMACDSLNGSLRSSRTFSYEAMASRNPEIPATLIYVLLSTWAVRRCGRIIFPWSEPGAPNSFAMSGADAKRNLAKRTVFFHNGVAHCSSRQLALAIRIRCPPRPTGWRDAASVKNDPRLSGRTDHRRPNTWARQSAKVRSSSAYASSGYRYPTSSMGARPEAPDDRAKYH